MHTILLVDDHTLVRNGFRLILESCKEISIIGECGNGLEALEFLNNNPVPDLVLTDIAMDAMDGITLIHKVKDKFPSLGIAVLSMIEDKATAADAFRAGAAGYISKSSDYGQLVDGVLQVLKRQRYLSMSIGLALMDHFEAHEPAQFDKQAIFLRYDISERELHILKLISQGFTNSEIADQIFLSKRTVEGHRQQLIDKTGTKNTADLVRFAFQHKILQ
ncbi:response regulator transcription factor [Sphingobacterium sp. UBA5670]|uniref:response regulator transcription factor n=1 Tax=Sphingobacterium sp. UBA5670 TaxID=1947502 RepID=UPI0025EE8DD2|nr:response regulator transcription factor [Sphingobacterium sp. UBA5670]